MSSRIGIISLSFFLFFSVNAQAKLKRITVCADNGYWYPFTYTELYKAEGLYVDMLKEASHGLEKMFALGQRG